LDFVCFVGLFRYIRFGRSERERERGNNGKEVGLSGHGDPREYDVLGFGIWGKWRERGERRG
jgi:hypothetical protein